jgi:hypothetical protein
MIGRGGYLALAFVLAVSLFSGYHARPVPSEVAWAFSPLGWLEIGWSGMWSRWGELGTARLFRGVPGLTLDYLVVFLKTCAMEAPFYFLLLAKRHGWKRSSGWILSANALTHPAVYFLIPALIPSYLLAALVSEAFAPLAEILFVLAVTRARTPVLVTRAILFVGLANLVSWQLGGFT